MSEKNKNQRAMIAVSGGVDSSVAAWLMKQWGYQCTAVTMRLYQNEDMGLSQFHTCCAQQDIEDASEAAFQLDIPFEILDFTREFRKFVIEKFVRTYETGGTPNPCIDCNRFLKFSRLLQTADEKGIEYIATGHYARIDYDECSHRYLLKKALDSGKDQSYVLYMLTQEQLSRICFPLGDWTKSKTRQTAEQLGLCNARKHDSQDICFVPDGDYGAFMERYTGKRYPPGNFLDVHGQMIGRHHGTIRYTLGQRKGLGLAMDRPVYVCEKDMVTNTITVGPERILYSKVLFANDLNWIAIPELKSPMRVKAKIRYRQAEQWATIFPKQEKELVQIEFDEAQRAITPGQAVVFYDADIIIGGGTITRIPKYE